MRAALLFFALVVMSAFPRVSTAQLTVSRLIGDGMVMQREAPVPVWGRAAPGAAVEVSFDGRTYAAEADAAGAWRVVLPAMPAGGPFEMTVAAGNERVDVRDILVGDVWVASGQSNMEWALADAAGAAEAIAGADDRAIRHFKVPRAWAEAPAATLPGGEWQVADPAHVGSFSAVGYYFARSLREHVDVPIGIINTSWGGSRIEPWMSREMLEMDPVVLEAALAEERAAEERVRAELRARLGDLPTVDEGLVDGHAYWAAAELDDDAWTPIAAPRLWEQEGYPGMDGVGWYRTSFELTAEEAAAGARLSLGTIDDSDVTWVNGEEVGRTENAYAAARRYDVPASALRPGRNVVAVRVEDTGGGGGIYGDPAQLYVEAGSERRSLAGTWKFRVGVAEANPQGRRHHLPTMLYNAMVHPLLPYPITGVIWYQGESNADRMEDAVAYRGLFADMITGWREAWGQDDFPFLYVQLANFKAADAEPAATSFWATLRESQTAALTLSNTAQAVIIDIGEAGDIHPRNKADVGDRLARAARKLAYGEDLVYSGPAYRGHDVRDGRVIVHFDHTGGGLKADGGALKGFAIAGPDRRWVWAEAEIEDDRVIVWSDRVPEPAAVRYAWGDNPEDANLYNAEGLPAGPFRTDRW